MSIKKQVLKSKPVAKVTFAVPTATLSTDAENVSVVGDFNNWSAEEHPLKKQKDGSFKATFEFETGKEYQFRYLINGMIWENDSEADKFVHSGVAADQNGVLVL